MIEFFEHVEQDALQIEQIHDHTRLRIYFARDRDLDHVVMPMRRWVVTGPEHCTILGFIPFSLDIAMGCGKFDTLRQ
jgi:hypothetical protein